MTGPRFASFTAPGSYWQASRAPRYSLLFALPLLVFYQVLAVWLAGRRPRLVAPLDGLARRRHLRGAAVSRAARHRARGRRTNATRLDTIRGGERRDAARRRHLLGLSLSRAVRRPLAALFVPVSHDRWAVLLRPVPAARVRGHGMDPRPLRRVAATAVVTGASVQLFPVA